MIDPVALNKFFPRFQEVMPENLAPRTIEAYTKAAAKFITFAKGRQIDYAFDVKKPLAISYYNALHAQLAPTTIQVQMVALRTIFAFYERTNLIHRNPFTLELSISRANMEHATAVNILTPQEVRKILGRFSRSKLLMDLRSHAVCSTVYYTCARIQTLVKLKRQDYDGSDIRVNGATLPVHPRLRTSLDQYLAAANPAIGEAAFLFQTLSTRKNELTGRAVPARMIIPQLHAAAERSGINLCTPEILRDSGIASFLRNGGNPFQMTKILGMKSLRWYERFISLFSDDLPSLADIMLID